MPLSWRSTQYGRRCQADLSLGARVEIAIFLDRGAQLVAFFVDARDDGADCDAEIDEHGLGQLQRAFKSFRDGVADPGAIERGSMIGVARPGDDRQVGKTVAQPPCQAQDLDRIVHCEHDRRGGREAEMIKCLHSPGITEPNRASVAACGGDVIGISLERDPGAGVNIEHVGDHPSDPAETDDDRTRSGRVGGVGDRLAQFDPARHVMADTREHRRTRQPDCGDDLPEGSVSRTDQPRRCRRRKHDQRGFRRARHQQAGFCRNTGVDTAKAQQGARDDRLDCNHTDRRGDERGPAFGDEVQIEAHPDADQEDAKREALERRDDRLDLLP